MSGRARALGQRSEREPARRGGGGAWTGCLGPLASRRYPRSDRVIRRREAMSTRPPGDAAFLREDLRGTAIEASYAGALSFARRKYSRDLRGVDVAVTGIPFDQAVTNRPGTRFGPEAIRRASAQHAWGPVWPWFFDPFDTLAVVDYGDCTFDWGARRMCRGRSSSTPRK